MEKIFGIVILYNPTVKVKQNIATYLTLVQKLIVVDNSEPASTIDFGRNNPKVVLIADGENNGIAARLNQAVNYAISEKATWLLTMDQDSFFDANNLALYRNCFENYSQKSIVAMFGIAFEQTPEIPNCTPIEKEGLITSGSLVNLDICQKIGGFDENLFIDEVDFEYCARAVKSGFKTIQFKNIYLNHSLGTVSYHRSILGFKKTERTLHSPLRLYYMVRNFLYVRNKYRLSPQVQKSKQIDLLHRIKNHLLYGNERAKVLQYVLRGWRHYKMGKMGKYKN